MKKIKKAVLIIMAVLMAGSLAGCSGTNWKDVQNTMVQKLDKKYGGEFVVTDVAGGRTLNTQASSNYTANAYPKGKPKENFDIALTADCETLYDGYVDMIMMEKYNDVALKKAQSVFHDCKVAATVDWSNAVASDLSMDVEKYIQKRHPWATINVLVKSNDSIDKDKEAQKTSELQKLFVSEKFYAVTLCIYYVDISAYLEIMNKYDENPDKTLNNKKLIVCSTYAQIVRNELRSSLADIRKELDKPITGDDDNE